MKKRLFGLLLISSFLFSFLLGLKIQAYDFNEQSGLNSTASTSGHLTQLYFGERGSIEVGVSVILAALLSLLGIVFLILMIYAGILWMTARGQEKRVEQAKSILVDSIVGIVIVAGAYAITYFVLGSLQGATWATAIFSN